MLKASASTSMPFMPKSEAKRDAALADARRLTPDASPIGAAFLARSAPSKLPWILAGTLGVAVLALLAYIVMR